MIHVSELDLSYAAGIIDGEGYIGITEVSPGQHRRSPQFRCQVVVQMCDNIIPTWFSDRFGGTTHSYPSRRPEHKGSTKWAVQNRQAQEFCKQIQPWLKLKSRQAQLIIDFYEDPRFTFVRRNRLPVEEIDGRREYVVSIKTLNARGPRGDNRVELRV